MNCEKITTLPSAQLHSSRHSFVDTSLPLLRSLSHMNSRSLCRFIVFVILFASITPVRGEQPSLHSHREFKIGVLVSLTGSWNTLGQNTVAALQIATDQLDAAAKANHGGYRFHLFVRDTALDPAKALAAIKDLDQRGVQIIIAPQPSAAVAMTMPHAG